MAKNNNRYVDFKKERENKKKTIKDKDKEKDKNEEHKFGQNEGNVK